ncbi:hypothetical protein OH807_40445 [Kitasatospora sp. NBC_01560]|uniref:hypothetical protein n=1 Tax=Kitasatospora sp. NBC_01560 TaxID=2975965 RepID=UPI00386CC9CF
MASVSSNAAVLAARLEAQAVELLPSATAVVTRHAMLLETAIKAAASGRPGPNAPTGGYRRSWTSEVAVAPRSAPGIVARPPSEHGRELFGGGTGAPTRSGGCPESG